MSIKTVFCRLFFIGLSVVCFLQSVFAQQQKADTAFVCYVQDTLPFTLRFDAMPFVMTTGIYRYPDKDDIYTCKRNRKLIHAEPTQKNHQRYYNTARSLFHLNRNAEAERMLLKITENEKGYYSGTNYYHSDIPGDTSVKSYVYGDYSSAYLHDACYYLSEIYIEEKKFAKGLKYLHDADIIYPEKYTCGTGYTIYRNNITQLYLLCYEGLGMNDSIINLVLPEYYSWDSRILANAIKNTYSAEDIKAALKRVETFVVFEADTFQTHIYKIVNCACGDEMIEDISYTSATARVDLFGHQIQLEIPKPEKNNQVFTKKDFLDLFYDSFFCYYLLN